MFIRFASFEKIKSLTCREVEAALQKRARTNVAAIDPTYNYFVCTGIRGDYPPNDNGDMFPWGELTARHVSGSFVWETWKDKNLLENHEPKNIRGYIVDSFPIDISKAVDFLCALDRTKYPKLAKDIESGRITDTSMGLACQRGICSSCGNVAYDETGWCEHMKYEKGKKIDGQLIYEISYGLEGLENSLITYGRGAEPLSKIKEILAKKHPNLSVTELDKQIFAEFSKFCNEKIGVSEEEFVVYFLNKLGLEV